MENYSAKIYSRQDFKKSDGTHPIYLQIIINRKPKKISLGISVKNDFWDSKNRKVRKGDPTHFNKNMIIDSCLKRANEIFFEYRINHKQLTFDVFKTAYQVKSSPKNLSFIDFAGEYIESMYRNNGSYDTYRTRKSCITKVKLFAKGDVAFSDITLSFLERLDESMNVIDGNSQSSRARIFTFMKAVINKAIDKGLLSENVFKKFKYSPKDGIREHLTDDEVSRLNLLLKDIKTPPALKKAVIPFLFSCYTGVRFKDISELRYKNIIQVNEKGVSKKYLQFVMHKTKDSIQIPLGKKALDLIPIKTFDEDNLFKVYTNQPLNRYLKDALKEVGIKKAISFHCARHTFASLSLEAGIPFETVSKLLGHSDLKTTQIYAKTSIKSKESAIDTLDNFYEHADHLLAVSNQMKIQQIQKDDL